MVTPDERRWVLLFACISMVILTIPALIGFSVQGEDWRYSGLLVGAEDGYSYLAKMMAGSSGDWLFRTPYTVSDQTGFFAFFPYLLLGKLTSPPGQFVQMVALFHLFRFLGGVAAILATYEFVAIFIQETRWRRFCLLLAVFGGGLGILAVLGLNGLWSGPMPLEFYSPESFGFIGLLAIPHLTWARACLLTSLVFFLKASRERDGLRIGLIWLAMGIFQPLTVAVVWVIVAAYLIFRAVGSYKNGDGGKEQLTMLFKLVAIACAVSSPVVLYNFLSFQVDPFLKQWQAQNILPSPPPGDYLLAYGLALPAVAFSIVHYWKRGDVKQGFLITWLVLLPIFAYAPYNLQRRLPEGIWVAISVLSVSALIQMSPHWRRTGLALVSLGFTSTLIFYIGGVLNVSRPGEPLFLPQAKVKAFAYLAEFAEKDAVVLASYDTSTRLPAFVPVRVPIGHGPESLHLSEIQPRIEAFFHEGTSESTRDQLVREFHARYIFWGPTERRLGGWDIASWNRLERVYAEDGYEIYEVVARP